MSTVPQTVHIPESPHRSPEKKTKVRVSGGGRKRVAAPSTTEKAAKKKKVTQKKQCPAVEPTFDNPVPLLPRRRVYALLSGVSTRHYRVRAADFSIGDSVRLILPGARC